MSFFCSRNLSRSPYHTYLSCILGLLWIVAVSQTSLAFDALIRFEELLARTFIECASTDASLVVRLGLWILGEPHINEHHPQYIMSRVHASHMNYDEVNLDHLAKVYVCDFSTIKLLPTLHSRLYF